MVKVFCVLTLCVGVGALLAVAGYQSTKWLVSEGVEQFVGAERAAAADALIDAQYQCRDHPFAPLVIPKIRVVKVQYAPERCATRSPAPSRNYLVVLTGYTFFLIPVMRITVCGNLVDCWG
ncbi:MAG: hypothetical protein AB1563_02570 [Bacillota bacterium]